MNLRIAILAACAGTLILTSAGAALASVIPGVDIIVQKKPGGQAIKVGACQSGGGRVVKQGTKWVCTGLPATRAGNAKGRVQLDADPNQARTKNPSSKAGAPARLDNANSRTKGSKSSTGFAPLRPAEF